MLLDGRRRLMDVADACSDATTVAHGRAARGNVRGCRRRRAARRRGVAAAAAWTHAPSFLRTRRRGALSVARSTSHVSSRPLAARHSASGFAAGASLRAYVVHGETYLYWLRVARRRRRRRRDHVALPDLHQLVEHCASCVPHSGGFEVALVEQRRRVVPLVRGRRFDSAWADSCAVAGARSLAPIAGGLVCAACHVPAARLALCILLSPSTSSTCVECARLDRVCGAQGERVPRRCSRRRSVSGFTPSAAEVPSAAPAGARVGRSMGSRQ